MGRLGLGAAGGVRYERGMEQQKERRAEMYRVVGELPGRGRRVSGKRMGRRCGSGGD